MINVGDKILVTTDNWFFAPDGEMYRAVFGTVKGVFKDEELLGVKTNARSTNWYAQIGDAIIAGCQIHYAVKTDSVSFKPPLREIEHEGILKVEKNPNTRIYNADNESIRGNN